MCDLEIVLCALRELCAVEDDAGKIGRNLGGLRTAANEGEHLRQIRVVFITRSRHQTYTNRIPDVLKHFANHAIERVILRTKPLPHERPKELIYHSCGKTLRREELPLGSEYP